MRRSRLPVILAVLAGALLLAPAASAATLTQTWTTPTEYGESPQLEKVTYRAAPGEKNDVVFLRENVYVYLGNPYCDFIENCGGFRGPDYSVAPQLVVTDPDGVLVGSAPAARLVVFLDDQDDRMKLEGFGRWSDYVYGGTGDDWIDIKDGKAGDTVDCGPGVDTVHADPGDVVGASCELRAANTLF